MKYYTQQRAKNVISKICLDAFIHFTTIKHHPYLCDEANADKGAIKARTARVLVKSLSHASVNDSGSLFG